MRSMKLKIDVIFKHFLAAGVSALKSCSRKLIINFGVSILKTPISLAHFATLACEIWAKEPL